MKLSANLHDISRNSCHNLRHFVRSSPHMQLTMLVCILTVISARDWPAGPPANWATTCMAAYNPHHLPKLYTSYTSIKIADPIMLQPHQLAMPQPISRRFTYAWNTLSNACSYRFCDLLFTKCCWVLPSRKMGTRPSL